MVVVVGVVVVGVAVVDVFGVEIALRHAHTANITRFSSEI